MKIFCICGCKSKLERYDSRGRLRRYISGHNQNRLGQVLSQETKDKLRLANFGKRHSKATKEKMSLSHSGDKNHFYGKKHSLETREKIRQDNLKNPRRYWLGKNRIDMIGEKHWNWKGGLAEIHNFIRQTYPYRKWRRAIIERDGHICQICRKPSDEFHVDHIKSFSIYPELRFDINNGRVLCIKCHVNTDTYGVNGKH